MFIINNPTTEKLCIISDVSGTDGGNAPSRIEQSAKWNRVSGSGTGDASSQITSIQFTEANSGSWGNGTTFKIWGSD